MTVPIHHLFVRARQVRLDVWLNGFPVVELSPVGSVRSTAPPINPLLVGDGNELRITLCPLSRLQQAETGAPGLEQAELSVEVRRFGPEDTWADPLAGEPIAGVTFPSSLQRLAREGAANAPLSLLPVRFDTQGPAFRDTLREAPPVTDRAAVIAHAMRLRDLFAARDATALAVELSPKIRDYAAAYGTSEATLHAELQRHLQTSLFRRGIIVDFGPEHVEPVPCCGGRLWHLRRKPPPPDPRFPEGVGARPDDWHPFLRTHRDEAGLDAMMEVFVGEVDGALRIVR